jgi:hypothetical protein
MQVSKARSRVVKKVFPLFLVLFLTMSFAQLIHAQVLDNKGTEFIMSFLPNYHVPNVELHLTSDVNTMVTVEYPVNSPTFTTTVPASPGNVTIVSLPNSSAQGWAPNTVDNNCVHAFAPDEFVCYMINRAGYTSDAALALPIDTMNTDYIVMDYNGAYGGGEFTVYAGFNSTTVTITPKNAVVGRPAGVPFTVTLDRGEGYHAKSSASSGTAGSLTGTIIESDRPVGLVNGNKCTNIPLGYGACDHIFEVAQPVQTWGDEVLVTNLPNRAGSIYRVLASEDNTAVTLDGAPLSLLNKGDFHETAALAGGHVFQGDKPIYVGQFMPGQSYPGSTLGDPAQGNMVPSDQYLPGYTFSTVGGGQFVENYVSIIADNADVGTLMLDGTPVAAASFTPIAGTSFSSAIIRLSSGTHTTASVNGHGITVEGYNSYDSYIYPGGARFQFINPKGDANPPICQVTIGVDTATGSATDNRPSEDTNGNGVLDPGEDLNNNGQIDEDTGIFFVVLEPGSINLSLTVDPFTPGDPVVTFTVTLINPNQPGSGVVTATDGAGNTCSKNIALAGNIPCPPADLWAIEYRYGAPPPGYDMSSWPLFKSWLEVRIENQGSGDAFNVTAKLNNHKPANVTILPDPEDRVALGDIPAGSSSWSVGDTFTLIVDMANQQNPGLGIHWDIEYEDTCGNHHIVLDVPEFPWSPGGPAFDRLLPVKRLWYPEVAVSKLYPNYPNPFNPETWIPYQIATDADVTVRIFDVRGQLIKIIALGSKQAGFYIGRSQAAYWDGRNEFGESVGSGVYYYNLHAGDFAATRKMVILK